MEDFCCDEGNTHHRNEKKYPKKVKKRDFCGNEGKTHLLRIRRFADGRVNDERASPMSGVRVHEAPGGGGGVG